MTKDEIKKMDIVGLEREIESLRKELFNLKLARIVGQVKDTSQFRKLRVNIAQILTGVKQKKAENKATAKTTGTVSSTVQKSVKRNTRTK